MDNATVHIAVGLRLGVPIVRPHICVCGTEVAVNGHHDVTAQDDIHATIKSTRFCVVHLTPPVHMQLERHTRSVGEMTTDQMEQIRFRGRGAVVGLRRHLPQHISTVICASQQQEGWFCSNGSRTEETSQVPGHYITSVDFIPVAIESSGVWGQHAMELVSEIGRRLNKLSTNHGQHRSCVSGLPWLFNAAMPRALLGHCRSIITLSDIMSLL